MTTTLNCHGIKLNIPFINILVRGVSLNQWFWLRFCGSVPQCMFVTNECSRENKICFVLSGIECGFLWSRGANGTSSGTVVGQQSKRERAAAYHMIGGVAFSPIRSRAVIELWIESWSWLCHSHWLMIMGKSAQRTNRWSLNQRKLTITKSTQPQVLYYHFHRWMVEKAWSRLMEISLINYR